MKKISLILIVFMTIILGCNKEDFNLNLKKDNFLDVYSYNFSDRAFLFEKALILNPNNNTPDPSGWDPTVGSVDLNFAVNNINSGLTCYYGICWGTEINPNINGNAAFGVKDTHAGSATSWFDMDESDLRFELNKKFIGGGKKFSMRESSYGASGSYNSYLKTNTIYHFRYFIYIETEPSKVSYIGWNRYYEGSVVVKYSENFSIFIP